MSEEDGVNDVDWDASDDDEAQQADLKINLQEKVNVKDVVKRKATLKFTIDDKDKCLERHKTQLKKLLLQHINYFNACDSFVGGMILSLLPEEYIDHNMSYSSLIMLSRYFRSQFQVLDSSDLTSEEGKYGSHSDDLCQHVMKNRVCSEFQYCQLFVSLMHALNIQCRYVCSLEPKGFSPYDHEDVCEKRWHEINKDIPYKHKSNQNNKRKPLSWIEVFMPIQSTIDSNQYCDLTNETNTVCNINDNSSNNNNNNNHSSYYKKRWISIDPVRLYFDHPEAVEDILLNKKYPLRYVVAISKSHIVTNHHNSNNNNNNSSVDYDNNLILNDHVELTNVLPRYHKNHFYTTKRDLTIQNEVNEWFDQLLYDNSCSSHHHHYSAECNSSVKIKDNNNINNNIKEIFDIDNDDIVYVDFTQNNDNDRIDNVVSSHANLKKRRMNDEFKSTSSLIKKASTQSSTSKMSTVSSSTSSSSSPLPTTLKDFKNHPVYLLERHLNTNEVMHPHQSTKIAMFKGEIVYLQKDKEVLLTKSQWRSRFRMIKLDEQPVKIMKRSRMKRNHSSNSNNSNNANDDKNNVLDDEYDNNTSSIIEMKLFGSWQTDPLIVEPVKDGYIPRNKHGNIEIWNEDTRYVPRGAVYIPNINAKKLAIELGIQYVPAIVGFEHKSNGIIIPKIGGIVVLTEYEQMLLDALFYSNALKDEQYYIKQEKMIIGKWEKLVITMLNRQKLKEKYGH